MARDDDPELLDAILRQNFFFYLCAVFPLLNGGAMMLSNWHIEAMAYALECVRVGAVTRQAIAIPPRHLKSICASVAWPSFILGHDPTARIICASYSDSLARKFANDCRTLMKTSFYTGLFPGTRISPSKDTELEIATTAGGFRLATSVGGTLTGRGGNFIITDDPIKPQDAQSDLVREHHKQWFSQTLLSRLDNKATDKIVIVMQRLHSEDLIGHVMEQGDFNLLVLPAIAEVDEIIPLTMGRSHHRRIGDVLHPERESLPILNGLKRNMGSSAFSAQYQQRPVPPGGNMIKWDWFNTYEFPLAFGPEDRLIVSWDTASSSRELADYSACIVLHVRGDTIYVRDVIRERLEYPDLKRRVLEVHSQWQHAPSYALLIESKGSGLPLIQDLKRSNVYPIGIEPEGDKVMRMYGQTGQIEAGSIHLPYGAPWLDDFRAEIMSFPGGRHDDQVDALSQALIYLANKRRCSIVVRQLIGHY